MNELNECRCALVFFFSFWSSCKSWDQSFHIILSNETYALLFSWFILRSTIQLCNFTPFFIYPSSCLSIIFLFLPFPVPFSHTCFTHSLSSLLIPFSHLPHYFLPSFLFILSLSPNFSYREEPREIPSLDREIQGRGMKRTVKDREERIGEGVGWREGWKDEGGR